MSAQPLESNAGGSDAARPAESFLPPRLRPLLQAICASLLAQAGRSASAGVGEAVDRRLAAIETHGWRDAGPRLDGATVRAALVAIEAEARSRTGRGFAELPLVVQDGLLRGVRGGAVARDLWRGVDPRRFYAGLLGEVLEVAAGTAEPAARATG